MENEFDTIIQKNSKERQSWLLIHIGVISTLLAIQITGSVFEFLPKVVLAAWPLIVILWGLCFMLMMEVRGRKHKKLMDDYFDRTYSKFRDSNEGSIRPSVEE